MTGANRDIIDFRSERARHEQFLGREDVLAAIDACLNEAARGWLLVTGQPGMGKSALLTRWVTQSEGVGKPAPHHFIRRGVADWDRPEAISRSLAAQIERAFPAQADPDAGPARRLLELLGRVSREVLAPRGERVVLVVDGLDEATAELGQNPLPLFLPYTLPEGVMVLCGSRPTYPHLGWLEGRDRVLMRLDLDEARWTTSNEVVCRALWMQEAAKFGAELVEDALVAGAGNALYAVKLREWLSVQPAGDRRVTRLPRGLRGLLEQAWAELWALPDAQSEVVISGLGVVCAAREAVTLSAIGAAAGWKGGKAREYFLRALRPLLLEESDHGAGEGAYRPYHNSFRELIMEKVGVDGVREHHRKLLTTIALWPAAKGDNIGKRYALKHAVAHAIAAEEKERARELCEDVAFLEGWCREGGVKALEEGLREAGDILCDEYVRMLHKVVRSESHWLRKEPGAMAGLLYNRLRSAGWETHRIREATRWGDQMPAYGLRHPVKMGWEQTYLGDNDESIIAIENQKIISRNLSTIKIWDLETRQLAAIYAGHVGNITACAVTPDGCVVSASDSDGHTIKAWDSATGMERAVLVGHTRRIKNIAVMSRGRAVSSSEDDTLRVWDLNSGRELVRISYGLHKLVACVVTTDDLIASFLADGTLVVWDAEGNEKRRIERRARPYTAWATMGERQILLACADGTIDVIDVATGQKKATFVDHSRRPITACAAMRDGRVISASSDHSIAVWDARTRRELARLTGHTSFVTVLMPLPDGRIISAADHTVKVWDVDMQDESVAPDGHTSVITALAAMPSGGLVSASFDHTLKVWTPETGQQIATLIGHTHWVTACAIMPDGRIVSGSSDGTLKLWQLRHVSPSLVTAAEIGSMIAHHQGFGECVATPDGRVISCSDSDNVIRVWNVDIGLQIGMLRGHSRGIATCAMMSDGRLVSGSSDGSLKVWNLDAAQELGSLAGPLNSIRTCAVLRDGRIVSGSEDGTLKVWDVEANSVFAWNGHADAVMGLAVLGNNLVISASRDRTLKFWDITTRQAVVTIYGKVLFLSVVVVGKLVCAGDYLGNLWVLEPTAPVAISNTAPSTRIRLFYSYAQEDELLQRALETHLASLERQGLLEGWHKRNITAGNAWADAVDEHLQKADVILLLVSAAFLASDYLFDRELKRAMERHQSNEACVIPIFIRSCDWSGTPFDKLQGLPDNMEAVTSWSNEDEAWTNVTRGIRRTIDEMRARRAEHG